LPPKFHARLAEALGSKEVERADAAMRAHVRYGLTEVMNEILLAARERPSRKPRA
jgi:DNA-binding FadR family transcriptional regulator